jgi:hypothetical protein
MRSMFSVFFVLAFGVSVSQAQTVDCGKLMSTCTSAKGMKKFASPIDCLKKAPAPIQKACSAQMDAYSVCAANCDKGVRGGLCRAKCGQKAQAVSSNTKPKAKVGTGKVVKKPSPVVKGLKQKPIKKLPVKKTGKFDGVKKPQVKAPNKQIKPIAKPKTGKFDGVNKPKVTAPSKQIKPIAKPKTGKFEGKPAPKVKNPNTKVKPMPQPKTGKFDGKLKPSIKKPQSKVKARVINKSGKYDPSQKPNVSQGTTKPVVGVNGVKASNPTGVQPKGPALNNGKIRKINDKPKVVKVKSKVTKKENVKPSVPARKLVPKALPNRPANNAVKGVKKAPSVKDLRSSDSRLKALKKAKIEEKVGAKTGLKKGGLKDAPVQKIAKCRKDKFGKLICKPDLKK